MDEFVPDFWVVAQLRRELLAEAQSSQWTSLKKTTGAVGALLRGGVSAAADATSRLASNLSPREMILGGVAVGLAVHVVSDKVGWSNVWATVRRPLSSIRSIWGIRPPMVQHLTADLSATYRIAESVREGNAEVDMTPPPFQAVVGYLKDGSFTPVGCAVRIDKWLVAPDHVLATAGKDGRRVYARGKLSDVDITQFDQTEIESDVVVVDVGENVLSRLGLSKPAIHHAVTERGQLAKITGPFGKGTMSTLTDDPTCFGHVVYEGTTRSGYSGAAYCVSTQLAGIHLNGGRVNGGVSASYVWMLISHQFAKKESSEDFLRSEWEAGAKIRVDTNYHALDEMRVQINGRYHIVSREAYFEAFGDDGRRALTSGVFNARRSRRDRKWADEEPRRHANEEPDVYVGRDVAVNSWVESVPEGILDQGEPVGRLNPGGSGSSPNAQGRLERNRPASTSELEGLSLSKNKINVIRQLLEVSAMPDNRLKQMVKLMQTAREQSAPKPSTSGQK